MSSESRLQKEIPAMSVLDEVINNCSDLLMDQPLFSDPCLKHWRGYGIFSCISQPRKVQPPPLSITAHHRRMSLSFIWTFIEAGRYRIRFIQQKLLVYLTRDAFTVWEGRGAEGSGWSEVTLSLPDFVICLVHVLCGASTVRFLSYLAFYRTSFFKKRATQTRFSLNLPFKLCCLSLVLFKMTQLQ